MRINIKNRARMLETISREDILIFPDREETVKEVDVKTGSLFAEKEKSLENGKITEQIRYSNIDKIYPASQGKVYDWCIRS